MPKQESSIKNQSKVRAAPKTASSATSNSATGNKAKPAAPRAKAASAGGVRRAANGGDVAERIRRRAYEIWECEGRPAGREQEHWEQAEREVAKLRGTRQTAAGR
jgi:Protein of unknown function (DUF2934)